MKPNWKTLFLLTTCCTLGLITSVRAQVSSDGTLSTTVTNPDNLNFTINNGNRVGGNLFHSFREFSVPNGGSAVFQNPLDVQNIISRVTGGSLSQINGLIQAQGSANLFLLNPAGIFFGQNARLSIGGSFFATTADSLLFGDGIEFSATNPQAPLLTVNIPIGLRFRDNPGNITNQSVVQDNTGFGIGLQVNPGNSLALVGGNVSLEQGGRLTAAGGRIELGGLTGAGTVGLDTTGNTFRLNFPTNGLSNVSLADNAQVTVRSNGGGDIAVNANIFTATNGGQLVAGVEGIATRNGGDITVNSNDVSFDGVSSNRFTSGIFNQVRENGRGNAGDINITTQNLSLTNGAEITASTFGRGNAGTVKIQASDISFDGVGRTGFSSGIFSNVERNAVGNAGGIDITTGTLSLTNGAIINASTFGMGDAGTVKIQASDTIKASGVGSNDVGSSIRSNVQLNAIGNAGGIDISTKNLSLTNGAQIAASTFNRGNAGTVKIQASDISFDGAGRTGFSSGIFSNVERNAVGNAGGIDITTGTLSLFNGAQITASTFGTGDAGSVKIQASDTIKASGVGSNDVGSSIRSNVQLNAIGNAGGIDISTKNLSLTNGAQIAASTFNRGNAGTVKIQASDISFDGAGRTGFSSGIFSNVERNAVGNAGGIDITTGTLSLTNGAIINASTFNRGDAGRIKIQASDTIKASGVGSNRVTSSIRSNVQENAMGNAGGIDISTKNLSFINGAQIIANTLSNGNAGSVKIQANDISFDGVSSNGFTSGIFSVAQGNAEGNAGGIDITTGTLSLKNGAVINTSTYGNGSAGSVKIQARNISFDGVGRTGFSSGAFSAVQGDAVGNAGGIDITTGTLSLTNGGVLSASSSNGNAGNVTINASDRVFFAGLGSNGFGSGVYSLVPSGASGNAGNIIINAASIFLDDRAVLITTNSSGGLAGDITLNARDQVSIDRSTIESTGEEGRIFIGQSINNAPPFVPSSININNSTVSTTNSGATFAGDIALNAREQVSLNQSRIESNGNFGQIFIGKNDTYGDGISSPKVVSLDNTSVLSTRNGNVMEAPDRQINSGNISIDALDRIFLGNGSEITAATNRRGNGGDVTIRSGNSVTLSGVAPAVFQNNILGGFSSGLFSSSEDADSGPGGQIWVETPNLRILDGAVISTRSRSGANAGNITVKSPNVELRGGGQILATAFNGGNAGNIDVTANRITISGADPTYFARRNQVAQLGQKFSVEGAERIIDPVAPESGIFVNSTGTGQGGNLSITGNTLTLDRGIINASTASSNGGNINLRLRNFVRLQNESLISADARGEGGGNGGNITIDTPFIVAFPQNNDIIANAVSGNGGRVRTNATLFGIIPRTRADLEKLGVPGLNPRNLSTSDITAFSEQNSNFGDNVQVTSPDVDPSRGLVELPETVTDPTQKIAQNPCQQGVGNEFTITGRGGLPTTPNETLNSDNVRIDLLQPVASSGNSRSATKTKPATTVTATRVPAQGWIFNDKGQVVLTAYDPTNTGSQRSFRTAAACPAR